VVRGVVIREVVVTTGRVVVVLTVGGLVVVLGGGGGGVGSLHSLFVAPLVQQNSLVAPLVQQNLPVWEIPPQKMVINWSQGQFRCQLTLSIVGTAIRIIGAVQAAVLALASVRAAVLARAAVIQAAILHLRAIGTTVRTCNVTKKCWFDHRMQIIKILNLFKIDYAKAICACVDMCRKRVFE
jgi:hypothetical protein